MVRFACTFMGAQCMQWNLMNPLKSHQLWKQRSLTLHRAH
jgi:hypothetical protein